MPRKASIKKTIEAPRDKPPRRPARTADILGKSQSIQNKPQLIPLSDGTFEVSGEYQKAEVVHIADAPSNAKPYVSAEPTPINTAGRNLVLFPRRKNRIRCERCGALVNKKNYPRHMQKAHHQIIGKKH
jgi:hypothetical protein